MTNPTTPIALMVIPEEKLDAALSWLVRLPQLPPEGVDVAMAERVTASLMAPCEVPWLMARIAALLSPYYDKGTPAGIREMEAEDWLEELSGLPQWAIERAVRWWKSAENPDRRKRPFEGDISARARVEMRGIAAVPELVRRRAEGRYIEALPKPRDKGSADERRAMAARVLADAGFAPKTFGGE
jgi:hypothetical protein